MCILIFRFGVCLFMFCDCFRACGVCLFFSLLVNVSRDLGWRRDFATYEPFAPSTWLGKPCGGSPIQKAISRRCHRGQFSSVFCRRALKSACGPTRLMYSRAEPMTPHQPTWDQSFRLHQKNSGNLPQPSVSFYQILKNSVQPNFGHDAFSGLGDRES